MRLKQRWNAGVTDLLGIFGWNMTNCSARWTFLLQSP